MAEFRQFLFAFSIQTDDVVFCLFVFLFVVVVVVVVAVVSLYC